LIFWNARILAQTVITFCAGLGVELHCKGLQTLRIKETDRIAALDSELQKSGLGSLVEVDDNNWQLMISQPCRPSTVNHRQF
jgi:3-phosphoshikimate 1-carboxyvinyltransferase